MSSILTPRQGILRWARRLCAASAVAIVVLLCGAPSASAHVVPWTTVQLNVQDGRITATLGIPLDDIEAATGIDLGDETQADIDSHASALTTYLQQHFTPTSDDGRAWTVQAGALTVAQAGAADTTGLYRQLITTFTLIAPADDDGRSFDLGYDAVIDKVITHVVVVTLRSDRAAGNDSAYELGTIELDTASNKVPSFHVDLDSGSDLRGLVSMVELGIRHIQEGTDHQLFLLALLIPAPLVAAGRRWREPVGTKESVRRICRITLAFTLGHSVTLALGALGLPVPQAAIEALIAVTIVVAAAHALRPIFPGREALVAGSFGLVHGLAFSETLRELHLSGGRLALSLVGFNVGIELMQLLVVAVVLPPLILLARARRYQTLRIVAAVVAGTAALGWFAARIGHPNPLADAADNLSRISQPVVASLWLLAALCLAVTVIGDRRVPKGARRGPEPSLIKPAG